MIGTRSDIKSEASEDSPVFNEYGFDASYKMSIYALKSSSVWIGSETRFRAAEGKPGSGIFQRHCPRKHSDLIKSYKRGYPGSTLAHWRNFVGRVSDGIKDDYETMRISASIEHRKLHLG
jgi:hypothetical protein